jgi:hypothetical protein
LTAEPDETWAAETHWLAVIAGKNVAISQHRVIRFFDDLDDLIEADTTFGTLDSATFVAKILDSIISRQSTPSRTTSISSASVP